MNEVRPQDFADDGIFARYMKNKVFRKMHLQVLQDKIETERQVKLDAALKHQ